MMDKAVIERLLELIDKHGLTVNSLARLSAVPPTTLKNIIYGNSKNPGVVTIKMLCDGLGISVYEFFDTDVFRNLEQEIK